MTEAKKRWGTGQQQMENPPKNERNPDASSLMDNRDIYFLELIFLDKLTSLGILY